jgi:myo-inositol-1(or 4)-monophosphatase
LRADEAISFELAPDLALIREAAEEAGRIAMSHFRSDPQVWMKEGNSPVSQADLDVDRFLRDALGSARPGYGWLSEESARTPTAEGHGRTFVVDPIDGTRAFINGGDIWCVSIAVVENGISQVGVLDCPVRREVFTALRGAGSELNGEILTVRETGEIPLIAGPRKMIEAMPERFRTRVNSASYMPSLAYRIAMVAAGKIDATFVKPNAHDWDLAAAGLILGEAGGMVLDESGKPPYYAGRDTRLGALVAGSGPLLMEMAEAISSRSG